ncbi:hypothetical protein MC885_003937 [Smutsia gigantea]|nr:hypothetical protein MC885_003937 [Smutsia gigantea]
MRIYKKGDVADIRQRAVRKGMAHKCHQGRAGGAYSVTQPAFGAVIKKQRKGKIRAKRINVRIEHIKHPESRESFPKHVK